MRKTAAISMNLASIVGILGLLLLTCPAQTWHVTANGFPFTLSLASQGDKQVVYREGACGEKYDNVEASGSRLEFRRTGFGYTQWYRVEIEDGVMIGRFAHVNGSKASKPDLLAYKYHITGWSEDVFPITPAVFDVLANGYRGRLRVDRKPDGTLIGRLKFYAYGNQAWECLEEEIAVKRWDGETLAFTRGGQDYVGQVDGKCVTGTFTQQGQSYPFSGRRAEVLSYGLAEKSAEDRAIWQNRTRRILSRLMMAGNPAPLSVNVEILASNLPPISGSLYPLRDDDPASHPQDYTLTELRLTCTIPTAFGPSIRIVHAYFAKPNTPGPYPLVVALNGHLGSAYKVMDGGGLFWYGDAWARRGYAVLAVDISHRPGTDVVRFGSTADLSTYLGYPDTSYPGDDLEHGNGLRGSIKPAGLDAYYTDWEEDGERVYDVMRGIDWAVGRGDMDSSRIIVTGLSMGGEVASYVGALDPRITATIPAGFSPDFSVFKYLRGSSHCWHWSFADIREYIDQSDILALIAPRLLIVETGQTDKTFSEFSPPYAGDTQVIKRARVAGGTIIHFLHPLGHEYRTVMDGGSLFDYVLR